MARCARTDRRGDRGHPDLLHPVGPDLVAVLGRELAGVLRHRRAVDHDRRSVDAGDRWGDYDRLGRRIAWAATDDPVYASLPDGPAAARLAFADIDRIAKDEHMVPGYAIIPPSDSTRTAQTVYGSYTVVNAWPQKLSEQRTLYLNQFTGETITNATAAQDGALSRLTSFGIAMHMGNQLGVLTRISATVACLGVLTSVVTGFLMWWKRRPSGGTGLPGPAERGHPRRHPQACASSQCLSFAVVLGVLFPVFGVSLLVVLAVEAVLSLRRRANGPGEPTAPVDGLVIDKDGDDAPVGALQ